MIFRELETPTRSVLLFVNNIILKENLITVLQESVKNPDVLAAYSPIMFSLFSKSEGKGGNGLWKHNSLCDNRTYINSMKKHIISTLENLKNENITDEQSVWEYLKYEIRKVF